MVKSHTEAISNNFSVNFIIFCMRFYLYQCLLVETKKSITTRYGISDKLSSPSIKLYLWNVKSFYRRKFSCELIPVSKIQIESAVPELSSNTFPLQSTWRRKSRPTVHHPNIHQTRYNSRRCQFIPFVTVETLRLVYFDEDQDYHNNFG
jgi:hypothetical protein